MYSFSGPTSLPEFDLGAPCTSGHFQRASIFNDSWETRCLRKHRRRVDDEGCSAKRRRLMVGAEVDISEDSNRSTQQAWSAANNCPSLSTEQVNTALPQSLQEPQNLNLPHPLHSPALTRPETESSCMEIEAAQRKLREIEDRITLEDDDEDLDVEPSPRRPVLVLSDSLKEGLQRGISDILPHKVAQSVSHSCMELVLWRPPDCRKLKDSLLKQRKQQTASRQPPTPCPSPIPHSTLSPSSPPADTRSLLYSFPVAHSIGEEDMEM